MEYICLIPAGQIYQLGHFSSVRWTIANADLVADTVNLIPEDCYQMMLVFCVGKVVRRFKS